MQSRSMAAVCQASVLACVTAASVRADVLEVGPGQPFANIQDAVSAASDGDVVLVSAGTYAGAVTISDVALAIMADTGALVTQTGGFAVSNLSASREVVLHGLTLQNGLDLVDNQGAVRVESCTVRAIDAVAAEVLRCDDVAFARSNVLTFKAFPQPLQGAPEATALTAVDSTLALYHCTLTGSAGQYNMIMQPLPGAAGLRAQGSPVFLSGSTILGGTGANGHPCEGFSFHNGAAGGPGAVLDAASELNRLETSLSGGPGGLGGPAGVACFKGFDGPAGPALVANGGASTLLGGTARRFDMPVPVRDDTTFAITLTGQPGDRVRMVLSFDPLHVFEPALHGSLLVSLAPPTFVPLGFVPASGVLQRQINVSVLDHGLDSLTIFMQPLFIDTLGEAYLGSQITAIVVDPAF